jgi:hypothetical protein
MWVREEHILDGIVEFFAGKIFNPSPRSTSTRRSPKQRVRDHKEKIQALRHTLDDIKTRRSPKDTPQTRRSTHKQRTATIRRPFPSVWRPLQDSNLRTRLRRPMLYPLS